MQPNQNKNYKITKSSWQIAQEAQTQCRLWHNVNCHIKTGKNHNLLQV
jgi:hypothetical protein